MVLRVDRTSQGQASRTELCLLPCPEAPCAADCPCRAVGKQGCPLWQKSGSVLPNSAAAHIVVIFVMRLLD